MDLVDILIALSEDEHEKVSEASKNGLKAFSEKCEKEEGKSFLEMVEDNFYNLITKMPRILRGIGIFHLNKLLKTQIKNMLKRRKESGSYLATDSRHRWSVQMTRKNYN